MKSKPAPSAPWRGLWALALWLFVLTCSQAQSLRTQEIAQCLPGEMATWGDGIDHAITEQRLVFLYSHRHAPSVFSQAQVVAALEAAAQGWSECGIAVAVHSSDAPVAASDRPIVVGWSQDGSRGNFGLADLGQHRLTLGPGPFELVRTRNPGHDLGSTLQMVISHEMGHFFGVIAHSRRCVDVTSYYTNSHGEKCSIRGGGSMVPGVEYRATLPTACDIARCRQVNRMPPISESSPGGRPNMR